MRIRRTYMVILSLTWLFIGSVKAETRSDTIPSTVVDVDYERLVSRADLSLTILSLAVKQAYQWAMGVWVAWSGLHLQH